jgi:hypothetical protein
VFEPPAMHDTGFWTGLVSTVDDLLAFARMLLAGGVHRDIHAAAYAALA